MGATRAQPKGGKGSGRPNTPPLNLLFRNWTVTKNTPSDRHLKQMAFVIIVLLSSGKLLFCSVLQLRLSVTFRCPFCNIFTSFSAFTCKLHKEPLFPMLTVYAAFREVQYRKTEWFGKGTILVFPYKQLETYTNVALCAGPDCLP